ncbi:DNA polymerase alpha subunit B [Merluccius polli]|uniref:DNA polymerase alpha subunit B n=1 Tax=Merluccius polli TaxID=89951 RepID=A0AA47ME42_MERPO|nr:DNA polymerase alpha subunit B [Merluccius polli]
MSALNLERIKSELEMFGIAYDDNDSVLDKLLEQSICNRLQGDEIVLEWVAFSTTKKGLTLSVDTLDQFEHEVSWTRGLWGLACLWSNYHVNHAHDQITHNYLILCIRYPCSCHLCQMQVLNKKNKFRQGSKKEEPHNRTRDIHSLQDLYPSPAHTNRLYLMAALIIKAEEEEDDLLDSYSTPAKGSQKRSLSTPEHPQSKRSAALLTSPEVVPPRTCGGTRITLWGALHVIDRQDGFPEPIDGLSMYCSATPSQKYSQRGAKGEVVVKFGSNEGSQWAGGKSQGVRVQLDLLEGPEESLRSSYKFMFQRLRDVRNVLTVKIEDFGEELRSHINIEEFSPVALPAQDNITVLGQVCCDSKGKLNAQSVVLEAGPEHGGQQVPVDLSELKEYSLFPGQVVVMEGMNTTGRRLVATKLHEGLPLPFYTPEVKQEMDEEPVSVLVACGPYTPSDSLTFDPLLDLITVIVRDRPDVCVLLGPFVDAKHEQIEKALVTETFEAIFSRCVESIVEGTKSVGCRLVFVPSQRDIHHRFIYPQPPFTLPDLSKDQAQRVTLVPDPCTLLIEGVTLGPDLHRYPLPHGSRGDQLNCTVVMYNNNIVLIFSAAGSDRFSRILKHLLTQRSYYPLYPPVEDVNMDYEKFQSYGQMPLSPDVLIVPSELRYFIKEVIGCVCVNPGRLTKGQVGGTYGRLLLQRSSPSEDGKRASPCLACQVVKI